MPLRRPNQVDLTYGAEAFFPGRSAEWCASAATWWRHRGTDHTRGQHRDEHGLIVPGWRYVKGMASAVGFAQILLNNSAVLGFMVHDVDGAPDGCPHGVRPCTVCRDAALSRVQSSPVQPAWITMTPKGCHAGWLVDNVNAANDKAAGFFWDVWRNLRLAVGGDYGFANHSTRNPLHLHAETHWGDLRVWTLAELKAALREAGSWSTDLIELHRGDGRGAGRNAELFTRLTLFVKDGDEVTEAGLRAEGRRLNGLLDQPMPAHEVDTVARSVFRHARKHGQRHSEHLAEKGRLGGRSRSPTKSEASRSNLAPANDRRMQTAADRFAIVAAGLSLGWTVPQTMKATDLGRSRVFEHRRALIEMDADQRGEYVGEGLRLLDGDEKPSSPQSPVS